MSELRTPSSVAWNWRDRSTVGPARQAAANRRKGVLGAAAGWAVAAVVGFLLHRPLAAAAIGGIALSIAVLALASPLGLYQRVAGALDRLARAVGAGLTWILMPVLFYLVFLPVGAVLRARGKLAISRRGDRRLPTYWISTAERKRTPESYRKQF